MIHLLALMVVFKLPTFVPLGRTVLPFIPEKKTKCSVSVDKR